MKSNQSRFLTIAQTVACLLMTTLVSVAAAQSAATTNFPVARMGPITLGQADIRRLLRAMSDADRAIILTNHAAAETWLRQRMTGEAVLREARVKGWADKPEVKAKVDEAVREITGRIVSAAYLESVAKIPDDYPSEAETQAAYDQGKADFNVPALYHVAQIFLKAPASDPSAIAAVRDKAKALATQARAGDFAAIARANTEDKRSAENGGDVGILPLTSLLPDLQAVVAKMKKGQVSDPIQTESGFHIVKLLDSQAPRTAQYSEIKTRLQALMRQARQQQVAQTYLATLAPPANITIDNSTLDDVLKQVRQQ